MLAVPAPTRHVISTPLPRVTGRHWGSSPRRGLRCGSTATGTASRQPEAASAEAFDATVAVLVPKDALSPYKSAQWSDVMGLMQQRFSWEDEKLQMRVFAVEDLAEGSDAREEFQQVCRECDMLVAVSMRSEASRALLDVALSTPRKVDLIMDSSQDLEAKTKLGGWPVQRVPESLLKILAKIPGSLGTVATSWPQLQLLWNRRSSDDLALMLLLTVNNFVTPVESTKANMGDLQSLVCMCTKCREQITACVQDPDCKAALDALSACSLNDQVCSYQVLATYESDLLEQFSLCILQKHNCLRNFKSVPMTPAPVAMTSYRGMPMTHELAEDLFIGNLAPEHGATSSWRVVYGKNAAYDVFPCQYQLFYRGKAKNSLWYDPVFKVLKINGGEVWRRRHYRCVRAEIPGTFNFSVLDNGVTSKEFWRIMDVADDMDWAVFYYSGAASTAGVTYRGALICSNSGTMPTSAEANARIDAAVAVCGIRKWEMYGVDNCNCAGAPLELPAEARIETRALLPSAGSPAP